MTKQVELMVKLLRSKMTGGCYYSRMSYAELAKQGDVPATSSPTPSDAPASETARAEVIAAPPVSTDTVPAVSADAEALITPPVPPSDSPSDSPAEIPAPEHTNILENVGMSVEPHASDQTATPHVPDNASTPVPPPTEPSALAGGAAYAALLSLRDKALSAIQFRRQARLEKIMALAEKKGSIGNDDVEKLLRVSDSTATRYLFALVRDGKLKQTGVPQAQRYAVPSGSNGAV